MSKLIIILFAALACAPSATQAQNEKLIGMTQISRNDGLLTFVLMGSFANRDECAKEINTFTESFITAARQTGREATANFAVCDTHAPPGREFEALRKGTPTSHYLFFTPSIRMMIVHKRGTTEYERQMCEFWRGQFLSKLNIKAKCYSPNIRQP